VALACRSIRINFAQIYAVAAATVLALPQPHGRAGPPPIEFTHIPATDVQSDGPEYDFRISRLEIRNDQFAAFLNDALANLANPRGQYLYFDLGSGDAHIHTDVVGQTGVNGTGAILFDASINGRIAYVEGQFVVVDPRFATHPVTGVTWFGAVKFCNWLTLAGGLEEDERAYAEAPASALNGWRPVTIAASEWGVRDLTTGERDALLQKLGFRLPMDAGSDGANPYNEWYKAAAARRNVDGQIFFDAIYGFGRDNPPTPLDANYLGSGDPFDPGTTPAGFYDGVNLLAGDTVMSDTGNAYGLYDLSGNVWEWLQDQSTTDPLQRRNRGGSWQSVADSLKLIPGSRRSPSTAASSTGFRIVQRVLDAVMVTPQADFGAAGPWGGPYDPPPGNSLIYRLTNLVNEPVDFAAASQEPWVTIAPDTGTIPVGEFSDVHILIAPDCADILPSGEQVATLNFSFGPELKTIGRLIRLTLSEPLTLAAAEDFDAEMIFGGIPLPPSRDYVIESASDRTVEWSAHWVDVSVPPSGVPWLTINGGPWASGEIPPHATTQLTMTIDPVTAAALPAGARQAEVTLLDECTGAEIVRSVTLRVTAPLSLTPTDESISSGVFGGPFQPPEHAFALTNVTDAPLDWTATLCADAATCTAPPAPAWLSLDVTDGTLAASDHVVVNAALTATAQTLDVGRHSLLVRFATGEFTIDRMVTVDVTGLRLEPGDDGEFRGPLGGPFQPASILYTLSNAGLQEMFWSVTVVLEPPSTPAWLEVSPTKGTILDFQGVAEATVSLAPQAAALPTATYVAEITFDANAATATRRVTLNVGVAVPNLTVLPLTDFEAAGRTQGAIAPAYAVYRLTNVTGHETGAIDWQVSTDQPWLAINGSPAASGSLPMGAVVNIVLAIDPPALPRLDPGVSEQRFDAVVTFRDLTNKEDATRRVSLTQVAPLFNLDEAGVPSTIHQPAGPEYSFLMGRFHVTNTELVAFLNNALANPDHARGRYMFFHTTTGDVYVNETETGQSGDELGDRNAKMFSPIASGQIRFFNGRYEVVTAPVDYSLHPAAGASWFGATKFCNWLTLEQGMLPREQCYVEDADPKVWRPASVSAADWLIRDLTDQERENLVMGYRGYRLPMDDGYNNPMPTVDSADDYNEWYKTAAWNDALHQNTLFGFGRGSLTGADANFRCSGDGFENVADCLSGGTTPVGYYDGTVKADAFATGPNANSFGLFDMTGNVHQWLQGRYAPPNTIDRRTLRGGSWNDPVAAESLRSTSRTLFASPSTTSSRIGFRVVRTPLPSTADFDADGDVDLFDFAALVACPTGPGGQSSSLCVGFDFDHDGDVDLSDVAVFLNRLTIAPP